MHTNHAAGTSLLYLCAIIRICFQINDHNCSGFVSYTTIRELNAIYIYNTLCDTHERSIRKTNIIV